MLRITGMLTPWLCPKELSRRVYAIEPRSGGLRGIFMRCLRPRRDIHRLRDRQAVGIHLQQRCFHEVMGGRERTDGIGGGGVSGKQKRLAAAAAEVLGAAV